MRARALFLVAAVCACTWAPCQSTAGCPADLPGCTCQQSISGAREFQCGADVEREDPGVIVTAVPRKSLHVQCTFNTTASDLEQLAGVHAGTVALVQMSYCPLPSAPLSDFLRSVLGLELNATHTLIFRSHRPTGDELKRRHLAGLTHLTRLEMSQNKVHRLPPDLLQDAHSLTWLDLRSNALTAIPDDFQSPSGLTVLELGDNELTQVPERLLANLKSLRLLNLWSNRLASLKTRAFDTLGQLQTLDLHSNELTELPDAIFHALTNLQDLNLSSNNFSSLPEGLLANHTRQLQRFRLSDNKAPELHLPRAMFANLPNLREINLSRSKITQLPEDFVRDAQSLSNLTLAGSLLRELPARALQGAANLTLLDLTGNLLEQVHDEAFMGLGQLRVLRLAHNRLRTLSDSVLQPLEQLQELDMSDNRLLHVHDGAFQGVSALRIVNLANNQLSFEHATESPLHPCVHLEYLDLGNNSIAQIFMDWQLTMLQLAHLNLSSNKIEKLRVEDVHFLSDQLTVDLRHNLISQLNLRAAESLAAQQEFGAEMATSGSRHVVVLVGLNPLDCGSCFTYDLLRYQEGLMSAAVRQLVHLDTSGLQCQGGEPLPSSAANFTCALPLQQQCPETCKCSLKPATPVVILQCCHLQGVLPKFEGIHRTALVLEQCGLLTAPNLYAIKARDSVTALYLAHNNLTELRVRNLPERIEVLEVHSNNLSTITPGALERLNNSTSLQRLTLSGNPWHCDCETRAMLAFVHANYHKVADWDNVTCLDGRRFNQLSASELCYETAKLVVATSMAIAAAGLIVGAMAALYYRYQQQIKVWLYAHGLCLWLVTEDELDKDKQYDAFVSYSHCDEAFVAQHLVPALEPPFKLCIHVRDWVAGDWIPEQIARSVASSRRTLIILSPNFLDSVWGRLEFRAAHQQAMSEGRVRVIVILLQEVGPIDQLDPELRAYLTMNTYLQWGDPWFWDKLRYALPHNGKKPPCRRGRATRRIQHAALGAQKIEEKLELSRTTPYSPPNHVQLADKKRVANGQTRIVDA